jgi:hypothetical protein
MEYIVNYDKTLDELKAAAEELLTGPLGLGHLYQIQDRKKLFPKYLHAIANIAATVLGDEKGELRQSLNCSQCHRFMSRVGGVVYMNGNKTVSVYWNPDVVTDPVMKQVVAELKKWVESSRVHNLFDPEGAYAHYTEHTHNTQDRRHFFIAPEQLVPRSSVNGIKLSMPHKGTFFGRMHALIDFAQTITLPTLMTVDQWFQTKLLTPAGDSVTTMKALKNLLTSLATIKNQPDYLGLKTFDKETTLVNLLWRYALTDSNLLTAKNSSLGELLTRLQAFNDGKRADDSIAKIQAAYKDQTSAIKYQRTVAPASVNQIEKTMIALEEGDWLRSMEQQEALEAELPAVWVSKAPYSEEAPVQEAEEETSFAAFAAKAKTGEGKKSGGVLTATGLTDVGYFFNEIMPNAESIAIVLGQNNQMKPTFINRMKHLDAKPIFRWDSAEKPGKFILFGYEHPFQVPELVTKDVPTQNNQFFVNVLSITTPIVIGVEFSEKSKEPIMFNLGGFRAPIPSRPALFADAIKGELYDHRRAIEDYSKNTQLKVPTEQPAVAFMLGARSPHQSAQSIPGLEVRVKFTPEYAAIIGAEFGVYKIDLKGYIVEPEISKFEVLRPLGVPTPAPAPVPEAAAELASPAIQHSEGADLQ